LPLGGQLTAAIADRPAAAEGLERLPRPGPEVPAGAGSHAL